MERSRSTRRAATTLALGLALTLGVPATGSASGARTDGTLVLGSLAPESGELAPILDSLRVPVRLAVDEINAAGGIDGVPVTLLTGDEGSDPATARASLGSLLDGGTDAVIGPASSTTALAVLGDTRGRALVCSGTNSAEALTNAGPRRSGGAYFRTAPPDRYQGPALAEKIVADGHQRVAVVASNDAFGDLVSCTLVRSLRDGGARVPVVARFDPASGDPTVPVREALAAEPGAVAVIGDLEGGAAVVRALAAAGAGPQQLPTYATDRLHSADFPELVDPVNPGVVAGLAGVAPASAPSTVTSRFHATLLAAGIDPVFSAHVYDCTILTALAAVKAGSDDPARMARAFASNVKGDHDCDTFAACRDLLEAGETIHWRGASSRFDRFSRFEPREGVYQPWVYDADAIPRDGDPAAQITIP